MILKLLSLYHLVVTLRRQWMSPSEIEAFQRKRLRKIIRHAYEKVPYYRRLFDEAGLRPETIRDRNDLQRVPLTTKKELQALPTGEITAKGVRIERCFQVRTSGSTGVPLTVFIGPRDLRARGAFLMRSLFENGFRFRDKTVLVTNVFKEAERHWYQSLGIRREVMIDVLQTIDEQIRQLRAARPDILRGLPGSLRVLAETILKEKIAGIHPKWVTTGGEILTEETREILQRGFGAPVTDLYNSWEFGNIAWECLHHKGYHINIDSVVLELIRDGKEVPPGESGEVVLTSLTAFAMPFIRYRIGDLAILSPLKCPCGRGLPMLEKIEGRTDDLITLPGGRVLSPFTVTTVLRFVPGVGQFRFVQTGANEFQVHLVEGKDFDLNTPGEVKIRLQKILGDDARIRVEKVDEIPRDPSGKIRSVFSLWNPGRSL